MSRKRKRDYRAEYKRRIERALAKGYSRSVARGHAKTRTVQTGAIDKTTGKPVKKKVVIEVGIKASKFLGVRPGGDLQALIAADARHVFGEIPKRGATDASAPHYQLRLEQLQKRGGIFDWTNEATFIEQMKATGMTEKDAYTHWFSTEG